MNRRGFLQGLGAMVSGIALEKAIPLGRVWSFPKEIKIRKLVPIGGRHYDLLVMDDLVSNEYLNGSHLRRAEAMFAEQITRPFGPVHLYFDQIDSFRDVA
jgi:hypothetical protein